MRASSLAVVLGGGNLFRGAHLAAAGMDRVIGDRTCMLVPFCEWLSAKRFLRRRGIVSQLFSAVPMPGMVVHNRDTAKAAMQNGAVVILTGGTGNPFFTTDTAACLVQSN